MTDEYRPATEFEEELIKQLIRVSGEEALKVGELTDSIMVSTIDEFGSINIGPNLGLRITAKDGPLISALYEDVDTVENGPFINAILFVRDNFIRELQIYKDNGGAIVARIDPNAIISYF